MNNIDSKPSERTERIKRQIMDTVNASAPVVVDPARSMLLIIDLVNDGVSEDGFIKSILGADITYLQSAEDPTIRFVERAQDSGVPTCFVQPVYDFRYLSDAMREQLESQGIPDVLYKKGTWGAQFIASLPRPDLRLVKSNFSLFSKHSFLFRPERHPAIIDYLGRSADEDQAHQAKGHKIMSDYFDDAGYNSGRASLQNIEQLTEQGVIGLDAYLTAKNIDTLIIGGVSTHVCVDAAVSGAGERGYRIVVPLDMTGGEDHEKHWSYLDNFSQFKGRLTTSGRISFSGSPS